MKEWIRTDDNQWVYQISSNVFKLIEIREAIDSNKYFVVDTVIDLTDYDEDELQSEINGYYDNLDELKERYPNTNDQKQVAAECIFEQMWDDLNVSYFYTKKEAYDYAKEFINNYKE